MVSLKWKFLPLKERIIYLHIFFTIKDKDHDSRLSYSDFQASVLADPLLLECFGQCLPDPKVCFTYRIWSILN